MQTRELKVPGAFEFTPVVHGDGRGSFHEWFRVADFEHALGMLPEADTAARDEVRRWLMKVE